MKTIYWGIIFIVLSGIALGTFFGIYYLDTFVQKKTNAELMESHDHIITQIDNLSAQREAQLQAQKVEILNNISDKLDRNYEAIKALFKAQNLTVIIGEHSDAEHNETLFADIQKQNESQGTISGLGKPIIIQ